MLETTAVSVTTAAIAAITAALGKGMPPEVLPQIIIFEETTGKKPNRIQKGTPAGNHHPSLSNHWLEE
jgi:hypothetical protein